MDIKAIFVPQGAEYQVVCRGLKRANKGGIPVFATPAGVLPMKRFLKTWLEIPRREDYPSVLLMGLCGSLSLQYALGDGVLYEGCLSAEITPTWGKCEQSLTKDIEAKLSLPVVKSITRDRAISTTLAKQHLYNTYQADVVDMEGFSALEILNAARIKVAMVRTVSDGCDHDIPNLSDAFDEEGTLQTIPLITSFVSQPIAAMRLIRGSMKGLQALEKVTFRLFCE